MLRKGTVIHDHVSAYPNPITLKTGECLFLEHLLNGWYWAHKNSGETGWIPQECITP
ncbi:hypothetical protein HZS38_02445 [Xenorhabdus nematophila]|uniref:SH3 domain-containing protein n=1 Tax=Xenorhabdus nematophila (strain ATCC 19061 / DSM 3370 / CCUG 14189 / LMG 1036 / NCIMB 9965 / AN6) TaxID=406817 RepID=D3V9R6_XENNA|nr:SH3 domain-containing protein [Xenorhabdus nematophila]CEF29280.1 hypothetical protein XNW1_1660027 [Xenorhabdus nematophila str. Websteri]AYA39540.1 hypothetical protein D3790_02795 [Xenorhabdus nematophila]MBA0018103.1 hypothetical protein [Xenorhabdus nematophila]MCB4426191.1 hypothetical protein [Xenorhabdus nematophila]QNJ37189.1 hypothetical protein H8F46_02755 [Xenorhabdus nematophila]